MTFQLGREETLHGLDDGVPCPSSVAISLIDMKGPKNLHRPARAHLPKPKITFIPKAIPPVLSRGEQIEQDINSGHYECGICCDENITRDDTIWYCQSCWSVYHLDCMSQVAVAATRDTQDADELPAAWKCPNCRSEYSESPWELCWCKKNACGSGNTLFAPNSCGSKCLKPLPCGDACGKVCHAGRCEACPRHKYSHKPLRNIEPRRMKSDPATPVRTNRHHRAPSSPPAQALAAAIDDSRRRQQAKLSYALPIISSIFSTIIICWVYALTQIVTEPFNYKKIAENNDAVRSLWCFAIISGFGCLIVNTKSVARWREVFKCLDDTTKKSCLEIAPNSLPSHLRCIFVLGQGVVGLLRVILGLALFLAVPFWVLGPVVSPIAAPLSARSLDFHDVCKGFDTRITLDIRDELRIFPVIKDLGPQGHQKAFNKSEANVESYTMAIANATYISASMELNSYNPSYSEVFGIPEPLRNSFNTRMSTYVQSSSDWDDTFVHTNRMDEPQPKQSSAGATEKSTAPKLLTRLFDGTWKSAGPFTLSEEPGFYRTLYDFENRTWATQIDQKDHEHGVFELGKHLTFPSLGLQVPKYADFASSCKYEPYLKMHRGNGSLAELERQSKEKYRHDNGDVVLRTASFGHTQGKLEMCARRRDVLDKNGDVVLKGLGDKLPVVAGFVISHRYQAWSQGKRKGCKGMWNTR